MEQDNDDAGDVIRQAASSVITTAESSGPKEVRFVKSSVIAADAEKTLNPDEIDLDDEDEDDDDEDGESASAKNVRVQQKAVPKEVFGGLMTNIDEEET
jgi:hypothetical protein